MPSEPRWIDLAVVAQLNAEAVRRTINGFLLTADTEAFADLLVAVLERRSDVGELAAARGAHVTVIQD